MDSSPPGFPLSVGIPRQEYWSGLLFPSPTMEAGGKVNLHGYGQYFLSYIASTKCVDFYTHLMVNSKYLNFGNIWVL